MHNKKRTFEQKCVTIIINIKSGDVMTLESLEKQIPELIDYTASMPDEVRKSSFLKVYPSGSIIHKKDAVLSYLGIVIKGENRVINEFENGSIYVIETNRAIDFIGEVSILANKERTSVTIEAATENTILWIPRSMAEIWIEKDSHILRKMAEKTAFKLYRSSYSNGLKLFYPPSYLISDFIIKFYEQYSDSANTIIIPHTRERLEEELGINIKTLNRTIRNLKDRGFFSTTKGKITVSYEQYMKLCSYLSSNQY